MRAVERNGLSRISRGRSAGAVALGAFALLIATTGQAAPLAFQASLSIVISSYGVGFSGEGVAEVDGYGHLASLSIPAGAFDVVGTRVTITTPAAFPIQGLQATAANGAGSFANPGGGVMPLIGAARVCLFATCDGAVANLSVPLDVIGMGGSVTATGPVNLTVVGAPWTFGTARVGTATERGFARGPEGRTSSTARASGVLQLVTPIFISTNIPGDNSILRAFGILTLHFVPEPTTLVLLGAGLAGVAGVAGRARRA